MASYFRSNPENPDAYTPGGKVVATIAGLIGIWGVGSVVYKYFSRSTQPMGKAKTILILREINMQWGQAFRQMAAHEEQLANRPGLNQSQLQMLANMMMAQLQSKLMEIDERVLTMNRITSNQLKASCALYADDAEVRGLVERLTMISKNVFQNPVDVDITLEQALAHIKYIFDLSITTMEDVFKALGGHDLPKQVIISQQFVQELNSSFAKLLQARRQEYYDEHDLDPQKLQAMIERYQHEPVFRELAAQHAVEKRDSYNNMGLLMSM